MIDIELARKRAEDALERANRAGLGPWEWSNKDIQAAPTIKEGGSYGLDIAIVGDPDSGIWICEDGCCYEHRVEDYANAEFIAAARSDVPALAQDLLQALKKLEHWKAKDVHEHNHRLTVLDELDAALREIERLRGTK